MKLLIDSANIDDIKYVKRFACFSGVTTNPSILLKEKCNVKQRIFEISQITSKELFVQIIGNNVEEMFNNYNEIRSFSEINSINFIVKVPINSIGLMVIKEIKKTYPSQKILGTAIYTLDQAILAVIAECDFIAPYFNRIINTGSDSKKIIQDVRKFIDNSFSNCKIIAASFRTKNQVIDALMSGAHSCTISKIIFDDILVNEEADKAVDKFNKDGFKTNILYNL